MTVKYMICREIGHDFSTAVNKLQNCRLLVVWDKYYAQLDFALQEGISVSTQGVVNDLIDFICA